MATKQEERVSHIQRHDNKLQVVLIGTSGSGKSATGNTIIGERKFESFVSDQSVTVECRKETKKCRDIEVTVIDTPGCHCTKLSQEDVIAKLKELNASLELPYAFLLVVPAGYFTPKESDTVSMLQEALGESYLSHTVIVFSHSDNLEFETREEFMKEGNEELKALIRKCVTKCHFICNRMVRDDKDIDELISDLMKVAKTNDELIKLLPQPEKKSKSECEEEKEKNRTFQMTQSKILNTQQLSNACFMLLGIKGVGKTTCIKNILPGAEHTVQDGCSVYSNGKTKMIECPGFDEDPVEIREAIQRGLRVCAPGPHIILIVMKVDRFSPATKKTMQHVQKILGEAAQKCAVIIFTRKADLEDKNIDDFIYENKDLHNFVKMSCSTYFALENRGADIQRQVMELSKMIGGLPKNNSVTSFKGSEKHPTSAVPGPFPKGEPPLCQESATRSPQSSSQAKADNQPFYV